MRKLTKLKSLFILCLVICFCSCGETHIHEVINRTKTIEIQTEVLVKKVRSNENYQIITIEGCDYIRYFQVEYSMDNGRGAAGGLCHKANCKNH